MAYKKFTNIKHLGESTILYWYRIFFKVKWDYLVPQQITSSTPVRFGTKQNTRCNCYLWYRLPNFFKHIIRNIRTFVFGRYWLLPVPVQQSVQILCHFCLPLKTFEGKLRLRKRWTTFHQKWGHCYQTQYCKNQGENKQTITLQ